MKEIPFESQEEEQIIALLFGRSKEALKLIRARYEEDCRKFAPEIGLEAFRECFLSRFEVGAENSELLNEEAKRVASLVEQYLYKVSKRKRMMFLRRYKYIDSIEGIAELFSVTPDTVSVTLRRMRDDLREYMRKTGIQI